MEKGGHAMNHISKEQWDAFFSGTMTQEDTLSLLEHTSHCTYCADCMADVFPESKMLLPPKGLRYEIEQNCTKQKLSIQKKWEFFAYASRVTAGVMLSILLLFQISGTGATMTSQKKTYPIAATIYNASKKATARLNTWVINDDSIQKQNEMEDPL